LAFARLAFQSGKGTKMKKIVPTIAAAIVVASTHAQAAGCAQSQSAAVGLVEIVQFRLASGVTRDAFLAAASKTTPELCATKGFIGRTLLEGEDGKWTDYVQWVSADDAQAAMAGSAEKAALKDFIISIDPDSMVLSYQVPVALK
jgi:hypothetical protein